MAEMEKQIQTVHKLADHAGSEQEKFEHTKKMSHLYWSMAEAYFRMFYSSFNFLHLTHAELYFQLAIDALSTIQQQPSIFLNLSLFASQQEKLFYQFDASKKYMDAMIEYRVTERVPEEHALNQGNPPSSHPLFQQTHVKCHRVASPEDEVDAMELEDDAKSLFDFGI